MRRKEPANFFFRKDAKRREEEKKKKKNTSRESGSDPPLLSQGLHVAMAGAAAEGFFYAAVDKLSFLQRKLNARAGAFVCYNIYIM